MKTKPFGYRNPNQLFQIETTVEQFSFDRNDTHLKLPIFNKTNLASVERVAIYLEDHRVISKVFVVAGELVYYYEKEWYYNWHADPRSEVPKPKFNVCERFKFEPGEILAIKRINDPLIPLFDIGYWLNIEWIFGSKPNALDTRKAIELNIFVSISKWKNLPTEDIIYPSKSHGN